MPKTIQTLSPEQSNKLVDCLKLQHTFGATGLHAERNVLICLLLLDTGLRVGELVKLKVMHVWLNNEPSNCIEVVPSITKTKTGRTVPLTERAKRAILEYSKNRESNIFLNPNNFLFNQARHYKPISTRQVERIIRTAGQESLGIRVHPHMLRHTFATRLMQKTNIRIVQALLGHQSLQSTQIYTHPNDQDLKKAIDSMD